jgi:cytochrome c oxidase subunit 3
MAAFGLFLVILGAGQWINGEEWGKYSLFAGLIWFLVVLYQWFSEAIHESESGQFGHKIDLSYRWSMTWFIFSEVMFFGAFFTALWWARSHSLPALGSLENALLWRPQQNHQVHVDDGYFGLGVFVRARLRICPRMG